MPAWIGHLLLAIAVCALAAASIRVASLAAPRGLARLLAAAPLAVAVAVVEALALGLVGWGGSPVALTLAAVLTWAVVRVATPAPSWRLRDDLLDAWGPLHREWRMVAGAVAGLGVAYLVFLLRYPELGFDGVVYHLPEVVAWVQGGHPGSVVTTIQGLPVGAYPVTDEVAIAWATGIARSMVPLTLFTPLTLVLLLTAGWAGLRALRAPAWATALALAALAVQPLMVAQLTGPNTDLPALAWLACETALCTLATQHKGVKSFFATPSSGVAKKDLTPVLWRWARAAGCRWCAASGARARAATCARGRRLLPCRRDEDDRRAAGVDRARRRALGAAPRAAAAARPAAGGPGARDPRGWGLVPAQSLRPRIAAVAVRLGAVG